MYCFDLQCFLWLLTDSNSLSLQCIATVWAQQLFRMWDRFWALPRCTNMPWTRIRSPRWRNRVAFGGQHRCWEVPRIRLRTLQVIGSQSRYLSLTQMQKLVLMWNWDSSYIHSMVEFCWLAIILHAKRFRQLKSKRSKRFNFVFMDDLIWTEQCELRCPGLWPHKKWNSKHFWNTFFHIFSHF